MRNCSEVLSHRSTQPSSCCQVKAFANDLPWLAFSAGFPVAPPEASGCTSALASLLLLHLGGLSLNTVQLSLPALRLPSPACMPYSSCRFLHCPVTSDPFLIIWLLSCYCFISAILSLASLGINTFPKIIDSGKSFTLREK